MRKSDRDKGQEEIGRDRENVCSLCEYVSRMRNCAGMCVGGKK